ncbi:hypothetical protein BDV93DRAFT_603644 [Ceratobasidium sp. AG-I]|nr:hypothetical protein BDV93DRAFT_603644 [Ceratobasidium sp. AG-I]
MDQAYTKFQPELQLQSGRYRIVSEIAGTLIQVSEHDYNKTVTWEKHERENQQWFVQKSGSGYRFKNCQHGHYLAVSSTDNGTLIYASRFSMTWVLLKSGVCHMIQYPGSNQVLDLGYGLKHNGNEIHLWPTGINEQFKTWRFERIGDDTGEELPEVFRVEVERLRQEVIELKRDVTQGNRMLAEQEVTISQLRQQRDALKNDNARLQGKMDGIEYAMAQASITYHVVAFQACSADRIAKDD